jgi:hypothetical protein
MREAALLLLFALGGCGLSPAERAVAQAVGDPDARFQALRSRGDHVCGEVNARNMQGLRSQYVRFVYDGRSAFIDPGPAPASAIPPDEAACGKPLSYQTPDERLSCAQAPRLQNDMRRRRAFEELWQRACG